MSFFFYIFLKVTDLESYAFSSQAHFNFLFTLTCLATPPAQNMCTENKFNILLEETKDTHTQKKDSLE